MLDLITLAARVAVSPDPNDPRGFLVGSVGVRKDGTVVSARNGAVIATDVTGRWRSFPQAHAEARCVKKMDHGGEVYVARVSRGDGRLLMSRPCRTCQRALLSRGVKRVYYSVSETEYGVWDLDSVERRKRL